MTSTPDQAWHLPRTVVLIGIMGAGKSSVGRLLARRSQSSFHDADEEIELAANCTISEFFARFGEARFRRTEEETITKLITGPPSIVATGGGAFMSPHIRAKIRECGVSMWIRADIDTLYERVSRRTSRPLLNTADPRATLNGLLQERYPVYATADLIVDSQAGPIEDTVERAWLAIISFFSGNCRPPS